jgi:Rrf2 family nitric oxide-sensitive transcriptional repressor
MRLTTHTDYALRVLMALAVIDDRLVTIEELAERHRVSRNHLMKVVQTLVGHGLVRGVRGRRGGLVLARPAEEIRIGAVVRLTETDMDLVACMGAAPESCVFAGACRLTNAFQGAIDAFFRELDRLTLADLVLGRSGIRSRLELAS